MQGNRNNNHRNGSLSAKLLMTLRPENKNLHKGSEPRCYSLTFSAPFLKIPVRCNFMQFLMPEDLFPVTAVKKLVKQESCNRLRNP